MVNKSVISSEVIVSLSVCHGRSVVKFQHLSRVVLREILYEQWLVDQLSGYIQSSCIYVLTWLDYEGSTNGVCLCLCIDQRKKNLGVD